MSNPPFAFQRLDHVVLRTADVNRLRAFYEALGCRLERELDGLVQLRMGESLLDLVDVNSRIGRAGNTGSPPDVDGRNVDHFAVRIEPFDKDALMAFLSEAAIPAFSLPKPIYGADGFGPAIYVTDPDGNRLELKGPPVEPPLSPGPP